MDVIQKAMRDVVSNPRGTAYYRLNGMRIPVYGKTGTAETSLGVPHAWFAGYTDANLEGRQTSPGGAEYQVKAPSGLHRSSSASWIAMFTASRRACTRGNRRMGSSARPLPKGKPRRRRRIYRFVARAYLGTVRAPA
jgi:membrane peptidoglycan carboxypeptidase